MTLCLLEVLLVHAHDLVHDRHRLSEKTSDSCSKVVCAPGVTPWPRCHHDLGRVRRMSFSLVKLMVAFDVAKFTTLKVRPGSAIASYRQMSKNLIIIQRITSEFAFG